MARRDDEVLETLLSDPLTLSLMRADRVDPRALRADLQRVSERLRTHRHSGASLGLAQGSSRWGRLRDDCVNAAPRHRASPTAAPRSDRA